MSLTPAGPRGTEPNSAQAQEAKYLAVYFRVKLHIIPFPLHPVCFFLLLIYNFFVVSLPFFKMFHVHERTRCVLHVFARSHWIRLSKFSPLSSAVCSAFDNEALGQVSGWHSGQDTTGHLCPCQCLCSLHTLGSISDGSGSWYLGDLGSFLDSEQPRLLWVSKG